MGKWSHVLWHRGNRGDLPPPAPSGSSIAGVLRESETLSGALEVNAPDLAGPVLALDTTGSFGSVALGFAGSGSHLARVEVRTFEPSTRHSRNLLPAVRGVLEQTQVKSDELALLVATRGPGSFTGLRIGLATLQGFALAGGTAAAGVSSLDAAALADFQDGEASLRRLVVVDALRGELFAAVYDGDQPKGPAEGPFRLLPGEAAAWARERGVQRICGPAVARYRETIEGGTSGIEVLAERRPLAPAALRLGLGAARRGEFTLEPLYLRAPDIHRGNGAVPIRYSNPSAVFVRSRNSSERRRP